MIITAALCSCLLSAPVGSEEAPTGNSHSWGLDQVRGLPLDVEVLSTEAADGVRVEELYFTSELVNGKPVRVYGFLAKPTGAEGKLPGLVNLPGGGGTANREQAVGSARGMGACVLNIDWSGNPQRAERVTLTDALPAPALFG